MVFWQATGKAPFAAYHSVTAYRNELVVFGGVRDTNCLNELSVFNIGTSITHTPHELRSVADLPSTAGRLDDWNHVQSRACGTALR